MFQVEITLRDGTTRVVGSVRADVQDAQADADDLLDGTCDGQQIVLARPVPVGGGK